MTRNTVRIQLGNEVQSRIGRAQLDLTTAKVAHAAGAFPYLKQRTRKAFFEEMASGFELVSHGWRHWQQHGAILDDLEDVGGLAACPEGPNRRMTIWMVRCYIGEPGGYGNFGRNRHVFFSDAAAPRIERLLRGAGEVSARLVEKSREDSIVKAACHDKYIARRFEQLLDLSRGEAEE